MPEHRYRPGIKASSAIRDPEFVLLESGSDEGVPIIARDVRLELFGGRVSLLFRGSTFIPLKIPEPEEKFPYYPLWYFIVYRSRVQFNTVAAEVIDMDSLPNVHDAVTFSLGRLVKVHEDQMFGGRPIRAWHYETEPYEISISTVELERLLRVCTPQLHLAMAYYLVGCENVRYFLVEFYKAIESIENAFGGEAAAISALRPYGLVGSDFKKLKRYASDQSHPFDIGRHAPRVGSDVRTIDVRRLLEEPLSKAVFRESVAATRQAIDAYFQYLTASRS